MNDEWRKRQIDREWEDAEAGYIDSLLQEQLAKELKEVLDNEE